MIFKSQEMKCLLDVLRILSKEKSRYATMFKKTKVSHTTLQKVLKYLSKNSFIKRKDIGKRNISYEITEKGEKLLDKIEELRIILR